MNYDTFRKRMMTYLGAIQRIPGYTASEKFGWLGRQVSHFSCSNAKYSEYWNKRYTDKLLLILKVEIARKYKYFIDIHVSLLSEDWTIVRRALKASWFFDGSHEIVNVAYFLNNILHNASVRTRIRIVNTLAQKLRNPKFANEMFEAVESAYDFETALPLMAACDECFAYNKILKKTCMLPVRILHKIFHRNSKFGGRLLLLFIEFYSAYTDVTKRNATNTISADAVIEKYESLLIKLPKKHPLLFVIIVETIKHCPLLKNSLSNKCTKKFLKKAQHYVVEKPHLYMPILSLKAISAKQMEIIFPSLMKYYCRESFSTDTMLSYLKYYPEETKLELLRKTYTDLYDTELLDSRANVTPALLRLLSVKQRLKMKMMKMWSDDMKSYENALICYMPLKIAISTIKLKLKVPLVSSTERLGYILQLIYTCKINKSDDELFEVLKHIINKQYIKHHKFKKFQFMIDNVVEVCELPSLSERYVILVDSIIQSFLKKFKYMKQSIIEKIVHFRLIHNKSIEDLFGMLQIPDVKPIEFNMLTNYPQYERKCLEAFVNLIEAKHHTWHLEEEWIEGDQEDREQQKTEKQEEEKLITLESTLCQLVVAMYDFNDRCKKSCMSQKIKCMTITDYSWLMDTIYRIIIYGKDYLVLNLRSVLQRQEPKLYRNWFLPLKNITDVTSGAALRLLKRESQNVLDHWEEYLMDCMRNYRQKHVQRFVRATLWYKDIPIKFATYCLDRLYRTDIKVSSSNVSSALIILSLLLEGNMLAELINLFLPTEMRENINRFDARKNREFAHAVNLSMRFSNPPAPLKVIIKLCEGYLSMGLTTLTIMSRRVCLSSLYCFALELPSMDVNLRRHCMSLMYVTINAFKLMILIKILWYENKEYLIRNLLYEKAVMLFWKHPSQDTCNLLSSMHSEFTIDDEELLLHLKYPHDICISNKYIETYFYLWIEKVNDLFPELQFQRSRQHTLNCLEELRKYQHLVSEDFMKNFLQKYLFHDDAGISGAIQSYVLECFLLYRKDNQKIFMSIITNTFLNAIIRYKNKYCHQNDCYFSSNIMPRFFEGFVIACVKLPSSSVQEEILSYTRSIFISNLLSPIILPKSFLLLTYWSMLKKCQLMNCNTKLFIQFGTRFGNQLQELVVLFSPYLLSFMAKVLEYFLNNILLPDSYSNVIINIINGLLKAETNSYCSYCEFMAVTILSLLKRSKENDAIVLHFQQQCKDKFHLMCILNNYLNTVNFEDVAFN